MFENILVGLDGSARSERSLRWGRLLAPESRVTLVRVIERPDSERTDPSSRRSDRVQIYLAGLADKFSPEAQTMVEIGSPAGTILQTASEIGADLILVTTHGESPADRGRLGKTTEYLISHSEIPVLVVPSWSDAVASAQLRRVVIPLDGSPLAEMILPIAERMSRMHGSAFVLTRILTQGQEDNRNYSTIDEGLVKLATGLRECGVDSKIVTGSGKTKDGILQVVDAEKADMIIMATHGDLGWKRTLLGTMAAKVVRESSVPVLIAKAHALAKLTDPAIFAAAR